MKRQAHPFCPYGLKTALVPSFVVFRIKQNYRQNIIFSNKMAPTDWKSIAYAYSCIIKDQKQFPNHQMKINYNEEIIYSTNRKKILTVSAHLVQQIYEKNTYLVLIPFHQRPGWRTAQNQEHCKDWEKDPLCLYQQEKNSHLLNTILVQFTMWTNIHNWVPMQ